MSKKVLLSKAKPQSNPKQELRKSIELKEYPRSWYYACWIIYLCYCYAAFFPTGAVWGIHFIAYVPAGMKVFLLILGGLLLVPKIQRMVFLAMADLLGSPKGDQKVRIFTAAIVAGICFLILRTFTIATDIYGDNIYMLKEYGANTTFDWNWVGDVFSPHWVDNKEALTVAVHRIIAHVFSISIESSYQIMSELCGALFIFIWLWFVQMITKEHDRASTANQFLRPLRIVLMLLGMFAGADLVFFGHVENYSFGILTFTLFLVALYFYIERKLGTLPFILLYVLAFKAHIIGILFLPAFLVALAYRYRTKIPKVQSLFTWRSMRRVVIFPAFVVGVALYIFLFHSWNEPYTLSDRQFERSFLPIVTFPAPLDHYSLWSLYHIADLFNLFLLTAAPIVVVLANMLIFNRKGILWSQPRVIIFGLAALFPLLFFMAMNPALSPVRDWDVYTLFFPPLLFFASMLLTQPGVRSFLSTWFAQTLVFGVLLTTVLVAVNASPNELQSRLLDAGAYTYRSYYGSSDYIEARALSLNDSSKATIEKYSNILENLSENSTSGADGELAGMMTRLASLYTRAGEDSSAILWAANARRTDTRIHRSIVDLAGYYIQANRLAEGSTILKEFLRMRDEQGDTDNSYLEELAAVMAQLGARYSRTGKDSLTIAWAEYARKIEPLNLKYTYDLAAYFLQSDRPHQALDLLRTIPPDSVSVDGLTTTAVAAANAFGPDSGLSYLYKAKAMAPDNRSVDSLIIEMKKVQP